MTNEQQADKAMPMCTVSVAALESIKRMAADNVERIKTLEAALQLAYDALLLEQTYPAIPETYAAITAIEAALRVSPDAKAPSACENV